MQFYAGLAGVIAVLAIALILQATTGNGVAAIVAFSIVAVGSVFAWISGRV